MEEFIAKIKMLGFKNTKRTIYSKNNICIHVYPLTKNMYITYSLNNNVFNRIRDLNLEYLKIIELI